MTTTTNDTTADSAADSVATDADATQPEEDFAPPGDRENIAERYGQVGRAVEVDHTDLGEIGGTLRAVYEVGGDGDDVELADDDPFRRAVVKVDGGVALDVAYDRLELVGGH